MNVIARARTKPVFNDSVNIAQARKEKARHTARPTMMSRLRCPRTMLQVAISARLYAACFPGGAHFCVTRAQRALGEFLKVTSFAELVDFAPVAFRRPALRRRGDIHQRLAFFGKPEAG